MTDKIKGTRIYGLALSTGFTLESTLDLMHSVLSMNGKIVYNLSNSEVLEIALACIECDDASFLQEILSCNQKRKYVNYILDDLLEYSIEHEKTGITLLLLDYKNKNGLYHDVNWEL